MSHLGFLTLLCVVFGIVDAKCPITNSTTVVYYGGSGATADCQNWEENFWSWWQGADSRIQFKKLGAVDVRNQCLLANYPNLKVYVQPGGNAYDQQTSVQSSGKRNILAYIDSKHGIYLGTCAGWFFASDGYWWQGKEYHWPNLLGRFPETEGSITTIWDDDKPPGYTVTDVDSPGGLMQVLYFGGPTRGWRHTSKSVPGTTLLTYADIPGKLPAGIQDGNMLLFSVHLEAYKGHPSNNITNAQVLANYKFRAEAINKAAGTNWKIPNSLLSPNNSR